MPSSTGVSIVGWQRLILVPDPLKSRFVIDLVGSTATQRGRRVGTAILCQNISSGIRYRAVDVYKLYGNGIVRARSETAVQFSIGTELWVNWFFPLVSWVALVPD